MIYQRKSFLQESQEDTIAHVLAHISSCCSPTDDPDEFKDHIQIEVTVNEDGSRTILGNLPGHEPRAAYLGFVRNSNVPGNKSSRVAGPVDLTPEELQEHLKKKFGVTS